MGELPAAVVPESPIAVSGCDAAGEPVGPPAGLAAVVAAADALALGDWAIAVPAIA